MGDCLEKSVAIDQLEANRRVPDGAAACSLGCLSRRLSGDKLFDDGYNPLIARGETSCGHPNAAVISKRSLIQSHAAKAQCHAAKQNAAEGWKDVQRTLKKTCPIRFSRIRDSHPQKRSTAHY